MKKKPPFKPEVTRVRLNPEQAVLACSCYSTGWTFSNPGLSTMTHWSYCSGKSRKANTLCKDRLCYGTTAS